MDGPLRQARRAYDMPKWCFNKMVVMDLQHDPMWLKLIDRSPAFETIELILGSRFVVVGGTIWVTGQGREMAMHVDRQAVSLPEEMLRDPRCRIPMFTCTCIIISTIRSKRSARR